MDLVSDLKALGVRQGDLLMVHASLRRLGLARSAGVEDGATLLLDALDEAVGEDGTLLMVLGSQYAQDHVNGHPAQARAALLEGTLPFDALNAPVLEEVGHLAEAFRQRAGTKVSHNPSGRFGARGHKAQALLQAQPWNDYYGPGSPLEKLVAWGGRILRLGANPDTVTALHYAEYLADLPHKRRTRWDYLLASPEGPKHVFIECLDDAKGIADWEGDDYFAEITRTYLRERPHGAGKVGQADSQLIDAADMVGFGARWMERNLRP